MSLPVWHDSAYVQVRSVIRRTFTLDLLVDVHAVLPWLVQVSFSVAENVGMVLANQPLSVLLKWRELDLPDRSMQNEEGHPYKYEHYIQRSNLPLSLGPPCDGGWESRVDGTKRKAGNESTTLVRRSTTRTPIQRTYNVQA